MSDNSYSDLEALGQALMQTLSWSPDAAPDWDGFRKLFHKDAQLVPAARPAAPVSVETFISRMNGQRESGALVDFTEEQVAMTAHVFGNIATVLQTYKTIINKGEPGFGISAMTCIREDGRWLCMSMAWDAESADKKIPPEFR